MKIQKDIKKEVDKIIEPKESIILMYKDDFELENGCVVCINDVKLIDILEKYGDYSQLNSIMTNGYYIFIDRHTPLNFLYLIIAKILSNTKAILYYNTNFIEEQMEVLSKSSLIDIFEKNYNLDNKNLDFSHFTITKRDLVLMFKKLYKNEKNSRLDNNDIICDEFSDEIIQKNKENKLSIGQSIKAIIASNPDIVYLVPDGIIPSLQSLILAQHFGNKNFEEVREKYFFNSSVNDTNLETIKAPTNLLRASLIIIKKWFKY